MAGDAVANGGGPVLVVGAGPVGLALACELRRRGVACRIFDDGEGPCPPEQSRALAVHARTVEVLDAMGLVERALAQGRRIRSLCVYDGAELRARIVPDFAGLETRYPFVLSLSQRQTEEIFLGRLGELGGTVEWRTRLAGLRDDGEGVAVQLTGPDGAFEVRAGWLVGCDGAHSAVRHALGLTFEGAAYPERFLLADAPIRWDRSDHEGHVLFVPGGPIGVLPLPRGGHWRLIDTDAGGVADEPGAIIGRFRDKSRLAGLTGDEIGEPLWASSFGIHRRAVDRMRVGRCFVAGDAAHIHSPAGGQGMNTGLQDAYNLAWKLALVARGEAAEPLLDSYQAERHPVALEVLRLTDAMTRFATLRNPIIKALRLRVLAALAGRGFVRRAIARGLSELRVKYRGSPIVAEDDEGARPWGGPRAGERLPDMEFDGGPGGPARLFDLLRGTGHVLLFFEGASDATTALMEVEGGALGRPDLIEVHRVIGAPREGAGGAVAMPLLDADGRLRDRLDAHGACLYLIRPDGYVGYRERPPDAGRLAGYLERIGLRGGGAGRG